MPKQCEFCDEILSTTSALKLHQTSTLYCLEVQKKKGIKVQDPTHKCQCGISLSTKGNLTRHQKTCKIVSIIATGHALVNSHTTIGTQNIDNSVNNSITINQTIIQAKPFSISDLTDTYIFERLTPVITQEIVKSGMGAITELIVEVLLKKDGKYCYYCTNKRDKKFTMLIDHEGKVIEKPDPNSLFLRSILSVPLEEIVSVIAKKNTIKPVKKTFDEIVDLKRDGAGFSTTLALNLPSDANGFTEEMKTRIEVTSNDADRIRKLEETRREIAANHRRKMILEECPYLDSK